MRKIHTIVTNVSDKRGAQRWKKNQNSQFPVLHKKNRLAALRQVGVCLDYFTSEYY